MLKTVSSVANALGALNYKGTWNATTNTPTLASGVGTQGDYYVVSVAGTTDLDGITNWGVGDWAAFNGSVWQRVEGGADGNFVNLDVSNTGDFGGKVKVTTAGNGEIEVERTSGALINLQAQSARGVIGTNSNHELQLKSNSTGRLKITTAGNVEVMSGNLVMATSGKGIDFSATAGTGTSELLDDYEEGVWTPIDSSGAGLTFAASSGSYTKVGRMVMATGFVNFPVTADGSNNKIGGLPFTNIDSTSRGVGAVNYKQVAALDTLMPENNATTLFFATATGSVTTNAQISNTAVYFGLVYTAS